jgi:hypothetical protein
MHEIFSVSHLHVCWQAHVLVEAGDGGTEPRLNIFQQLRLIVPAAAAAAAAKSASSAHGRLKQET